MAQKKKWPRTVSEARSWIDFDNPDLSIRQQCRLLGLHRSNAYYEPTPETVFNLQLMRLMDEEHLLRPAKGSRQMVDFLKRLGHDVNRKRIQRLMRKMGIEGRLFIEPMFGSDLSVMSDWPRHKNFNFFNRANFATPESVTAVLSKLSFSSSRKLMRQSRS